MLEEVSKTYLVHAVVCQRTKSKLPFHEAVAKGIIDKETGAYYHNVTGEKFFVADAMAKGQYKKYSLERCGVAYPLLNRNYSGFAHVTYNGSLSEWVIDSVKIVLTLNWYK